MLNGISACPNQSNFVINHQKWQVSFWSNCMNLEFAELGGLKKDECYQIDMEQTKRRKKQGPWVQEDLPWASKNHDTVQETARCLGRFVRWHFYTAYSSLPQKLHVWRQPATFRAVLYKSAKSNKAFFLQYHLSFYESIYNQPGYSTVVTRVSSIVIIEVQTRHIVFFSQYNLDNTQLVYSPFD